MAFVPLKKILPGIISKIEAEKQVEGATLCRIFNQLIEKNDSLKGVKALFLKNKTLFIKVKNPSQAQEIRLNQEFILKEINEKIKRKSVENLAFRTC